MHFQGIAGIRMNRKGNPLRVLAVLLACLVLPGSTPGALYAAGNGKDGPASPSPNRKEPNTPPPRGSGGAYVFLPIGPNREDVIGLAENLLRLSDEQRERLGELRREQQERKAHILDKLAATYGKKVRGILDNEQQGQFDEALQVLKELEEARTAARNDFLAAAGPEAY